MVVDLNRVKFMDTTALRLLLSTSRCCAGRGQELHIATDDHTVRRFLTTADLDHHLIRTAQC